MDNINFDLYSCALELINKNENQNDENSNNIKNEDVCKYCNCNNFIYNQSIAKRICNNCGSMFDEYEDIDEEEPVEMTITSMLLPNITNQIYLVNCKNKYIKNLHKWNMIPYREKSLLLVFSIISKKCEKLGLKGNISDEAKILYYNIIRENYIDEKTKKSIITRGKNKLGIIASCIYYACKNSGYLKTIKEIAYAFNISSVCLNNGCKIFMQCLKKTKIKINNLISKPGNFIDSICQQLNIQSDDIDNIKTIINKIESNKLLCSHTPYTITVACTLLYIEEKYVKNYNEFNKKRYKNKRKKQIEDLNISLSTLNKTYGSLLEYKDFLLGYEKIISPERLSDEDRINYEILDEDNIKEEIKRINKININDYNNVTNIDLKSVLTKSLNVSEYVESYNKYFF